MRAVLQRVKEARVNVDGRTVGQIGNGLLVYLSVGKDDTEKDTEFIARKVAELRVFEDDAGKMNLSVADVGGQVLLVSSFTLYGDCRKGRRPSFDSAAEPQLAEQLCNKVARLITACGVPVGRGIFAAHMHIDSINDGPVTLIVESH